MGRQNRTPTIVVIWSILLASIFSLLWVRIDPFVMKTKGPDTSMCGINCWSKNQFLFLLKLLCTLSRVFSLLFSDLNIDFNFFIFCKISKDTALQSEFLLYREVHNHNDPENITMTRTANKPWRHQANEASILSEIYQERSPDGVSPVRRTNIVQSRMFSLQL